VTLPSPRIVDDHLVLPVPESVGAFYAVPTGDGVVPVESLVAAGLGRVEAALPHPLPQPLVQVHRVDELPPLPVDALAAAGATDEQLGRLRAATHLVLVSVGGRPGWPPAHEWIARSLAAGAASRLGADVVDLLANQVLDLGTTRASLPDAEGLVCIADWVAVEVWPEPDGYTCTTSGLRRFGLPELRTLAVPAGLVDAWGRAMVGLAGRLLAAWRDGLAAPVAGGPVRLQALLTVTDSDVIDAHVTMTGIAGPRTRPSYSAAAAGGAPAVTSVRLALDPDQFLTIHPPAHSTMEPKAYLAHACEVLFGHSALSARPAADAALEGAIAAARSGMAAIRDRFAVGGLPARQRLLVRYALAADDTIEYAWAYVTSWRDPYRILATSAADSVALPRVRAGRPVVLDPAAVIDWAVEQDGIGIVEGGYTRALAS
jgi:hypothetical protein